MKTILITLLLASIAAAFPARLRWNKNAEPDITEYRVYQVIDGAPVLKLTVPATQDAKQSTPIQVESGQVYEVTAFNGFESDPSDPVTVPAKPTKPGALEVVEIQVSSNLQEWETIALVPLKTSAPTRHIRAALTTIPDPTLSTDH